MIGIGTDRLGTAVEAVTLFGSKSRGDADSGSDTDLAIFAHAESVEKLVGIKKELSELVEDEDTNLSVYSVRTAELMAADGSLFLWHLKREGRVLFRRSSWIDGLLSGLSPYARSKAERDMRTFECVLKDVEESVSRTNSTLLFEVATLFSVLRSVGMIVTTFAGRPCFGRVEPVYHLRESMGTDFPFSDREIELLLTAKLIYSRKKPNLPLILGRAWCKQAAQKVFFIMNFAREAMDD